METYHGHIRTQIDAILLFEACRLGFIPRIRRRLSERERLQIGSGSIYVWEEGEASMRRWTDGKAWSASRVSGSFLTYREMEGNRRSTASDLSSRKRKNSNDHAKRASPGSDPKSEDESKDADSGEEGFRYKPDGLFKQSFSITTSTNLKLHLIAYYTKEEVNSGKLTQPSTDPRLKEIRIPNELYPDNSNSGSNLTPPITTTPLVYSPYPMMTSNSSLPPPPPPPHHPHPHHHHYPYQYPPYPYYPYPPPPHIAEAMASGRYPMPEHYRPSSPKSKDDEKRSNSSSPRSSKADFHLPAPNGDASPRSGKEGKLPSLSDLASFSASSATLPPFSSSSSSSSSSATTASASNTSASSATSNKITLPPMTSPSYAKDKTGADTLSSSPSSNSPILSSTTKPKATSPSSSPSIANIISPADNAEHQQQQLPTPPPSTPSSSTSPKASSSVPPTSAPKTLAEDRRALGMLDRVFL